MEGDLTGMRFAERGEHFYITVARQCPNLAHQTALADTRRPRETHDCAVALEGALQQALHGGHLPPPTNQSRLRTPDPRMPFAHAQKAKGGHRFLGALNPNHLRSPGTAPSTSRAFDSDSITPPGGATDSIR